MAAVTVRLSRDAIVDFPTAAIALVAAYLLIVRRVNSAWIVLLGGAAGLLLLGLRS
jgi:chromate transporter